MNGARYIITYKRRMKSDAFTFERTEPRKESAKTTLNIAFILTPVLNVPLI